MSNVGQMQCSHRLVANLYRGIRLLAALDTLHEVPQVRRCIRRPTGDILANRSRSFPAVVVFLAPRFRENPVAVLTELQSYLLALKDNAPALHERVHVG